MADGRRKKLGAWQYLLENWTVTGNWFGYFHTRFLIGSTVIRYDDPATIWRLNVKRFIVNFLSYTSQRSHLQGFLQKFSANSYLRPEWMLHRFRRGTIPV
jgi:hypothetical protein